VREWMVNGPIRRSSPQDSNLDASNLRGMKMSLPEQGQGAGG